MLTYVCSDESESFFTAFSQETTQSSCPHKHTPTISSKDATLTISLYKDRKVVGGHAYGMSHVAAEAWLAVAQPSSAAAVQLGDCSFLIKATCKNSVKLTIQQQRRSI